MTRRARLSVAGNRSREHARLLQQSLVVHSRAFVGVDRSPDPHDWKRQESDHEEQQHAGNKRGREEREPATDTADVPMASACEDQGEQDR
jgi:hypothetical protein